MPRFRSRAQLRAIFAAMHARTALSASVARGTQLQNVLRNRPVAISKPKARERKVTQAIPPSQKMAAVRAFDNAKDLSAWVGTQYKGIGLSKQIRTAILGYQELAGVINGFWRGTDQWHPDMVSKETAQLDEAFKQLPAFSEPVQVFRGLDMFSQGRASW